MQFASYNATRMRSLTAIFAITHNRVTDMRHMYAQLMCPSGQWPQRHQRIPPRRMVNTPQFTDGMLAILINLHQFMPRSAAFCQRHVDPHIFRWQSGHQRQIGLFDLMRLKGTGQPPRARTPLAQQQQTRCILVDAVNKAQPVL